MFILCLVMNLHNYRVQKVVVNGAASSWQLVTSSVLQGSLLGPVLFTIFINDIDAGVQKIFISFDDNLKL